MIDFGYTVSPSSAIEIDDAGLASFRQLCRIEPDAIKCISCGSCAASCTAAGFSIMNLRKTILLLSRGKDREAIDMAATCMLCGKCYIVCPRGINTRHLILSICKTYRKE